MASRWVYNPFTGNFDNRGLENEVDFIDFTSDYTSTQQEARVSWNGDDGTMQVGMPGGNVNLQVGQEILVRAKNNPQAILELGIEALKAGEKKFAKSLFEIAYKKGCPAAAKYIHPTKDKND